MPLAKKAGICTAVVVLALAVAGCGDDDGVTVRESGPGASGGSASGSGSGVASGSATESGGCKLEGSSDATPTGVVNVELSEFTVVADPVSVAAGTVELVATNEGDEDHEVVVVKFDGEPSELPVAGDGSVDETKLPEGAVIGEIEGFAGGGTTCAASFDLAPGNYVLFCNIVEAEEHEAHYGMGMFTTLTVS